MNQVRNLLSKFQKIMLPIRKAYKNLIWKEICVLLEFYCWKDQKTYGFDNCLETNLSEQYCFFLLLYKMSPKLNKAVFELTEETYSYGGKSFQNKISP